MLMTLSRFSLKFERIVQAEQAANFITQLHDGNLKIIPWPVIESRQFYALFPRLKRMLDEQVMTHPKAGVFLQTMKTLMAKLKVFAACSDTFNTDSLSRPTIGAPLTVNSILCPLIEASTKLSRSENLASHRAQQLLALLPSAMAHGVLDTEFDAEPLKVDSSTAFVTLRILNHQQDLDSGLPVDMPDTQARFCLSLNELGDSEEKDRCLAALQHSWKEFAIRRNQAAST